MILVVLILLIPLRGWSAERLCIQMATNQVAMELRSENALAVAMPRDCAMATNTDSTQVTKTTLDESGSGCQSCHLCMPLAVVEDLTPNNAEKTLQAVLHPAYMHYASAELARHAKPPIP